MFKGKVLHPLAKTIGLVNLLSLNLWEKEKKGITITPTPCYGWAGVNTFYVVGCPLYLTCAVYPDYRR